MILIFSYSTKIGDYKDNDFYLSFYKISMKIAKDLGYTIKFYGCEYALNFLKEFYDESVDVSNENFILTDDLKIFIHQNEPCGAITIDGDLFLYKKLSIDSEKDISIDRDEYIYHRRSKKYREYLPFFFKYDLSSINYFDKENDTALNVGILRFKNQKIKDLFISEYYKFRKLYLDIIEPKEHLLKNKKTISIIICQYLFNCISKIENIQIDYCYKENDYKHYIGQSKKHFKKELDKLFTEHNIQLEKHIL